VAWAVGGLVLFALALEITRAGAGSLVPLLSDISLEGVANGLGFGWLFAYVVLSGSPVAAIGVTLLSEGVFHQAEAFAVVAGSRLGASFIVLAVGFLAFRFGRRSGDGLAIGIVAMLVTFTTQGPAVALGFLALNQGWLDGVKPSAPEGLLQGTEAAFGPVTDALDSLLPGLLVFVAGAAVLLLAFAVFERALPQLEGEAEGIRRRLDVLNRRPLMFLMGVLITLTTLSVAVSLTVLVPLALRGYVRREHIIPYVLGANIATFVDTLVAGVLVGGEAAIAVVLAQVASTAVVAVIVLTVLYHPYRTAILRSERWIAARPRRLAGFLGVIVAVPAILLVV
jgi:Na+/phosphate symporter